eukprot:TRINITY_DN48062_c0_g1_i1.p1 TRINITY_DN48062_c0_g1~~TRINITY_DN48062_c0_g1_i1.p1  ORF type:complete len:341 (+),score=102.22 TRINITY_DN48062_c0_g1_i1:85-1023(+)
MATMMPGERPRSRTIGGAHSGIVKLTKAEAQHITRAAAMLQDFEDEKRTVYQKQMDTAGSVFEQAREVRATQAANYEVRNKHIHDLVAELRARTDSTSRHILENLKEFSHSIDEGLSSRRERWRGELKVNLEALQRRGAAGDADQSALNGRIREEHEQTKTMTGEEVGPICERLREHSRLLAETKAERARGHRAYCDSLAEHFRRLKATLASETAARKKQCETSQALADSWYGALEQQNVAAAEQTRQRLADIRAKLQAEQADAANSNSWITHEMMQFMMHFEASVGQSLRKQEETKAHLQSLKSSFEFKAA